MSVIYLGPAAMIAKGLRQQQTKWLQAMCSRGNQGIPLAGITTWALARELWRDGLAVIRKGVVYPTKFAYEVLERIPTEG